MHSNRNPASSSPTQRERYLGAAAASLTVVCLLGACGSEDDPSSSEPPADSSSELSESTSSEPVSSGPQILPPESLAGSSTLTDLVAAYAAGASEVPIPRNMLADPTLCDMDLSTDEVYFAPTFGAPGDSTTQCTMTADQTLLLVPAAVFCAETAGDKADVACLEKSWNLTSASVTVDGAETSDLTDYQVDTEVVTVDLPKNNLFAATAGETPLIARAQAVLVEGLEAGDHEVIVAADFGNGEFAGTLTIALTVEE